jgi:hypothetical protein
MVDSDPVNRWLADWLSAWRTEPVMLESPLPVEVVRERLIAGRVSCLEKQAWLISTENAVPRRR